MVLELRSYNYGASFLFFFSFLFFSFCFFVLFFFFFFFEKFQDDNKFMLFHLGVGISSVGG